MLGFLVCCYLGEKVGWHWGFGAAGVGMTFGVLQYIFTRKALGNAGKESKLSENEDQTRYLTIFKWTSAVLGLILITGFFGFWTIEPALLNQLLVNLIFIVALAYFVYLFFFAGLNKTEKNNI